METNSSADVCDRRRSKRRKGEGKRRRARNLYNSLGLGGILSY